MTEAAKNAPVGLCTISVSHTVRWCNLDVLPFYTCRTAMSQSLRKGTQTKCEDRLSDNNNININIILPEEISCIMITLIFRISKRMCFHTKMSDILLSP